MCTVLLSPGDNPIAVNKYIISYHMDKMAGPCERGEERSGSYEMRGISWLAGELLASQSEFCSMELAIIPSCRPVC